MKSHEDFDSRDDHFPDLSSLSGNMLLKTYFLLTTHSQPVQNMT